MKDRVNPQLTIKELSWLAGIIDGEGCLSMRERSRTETRPSYFPRPRIDIASVDVEMIARVSEIYNKVGIKFWYQLSRRKNPKHRDCLFIITVGNRNVGNLLKHIIQYLVVKKPQAELLLRYCLWRNEILPKDSIKKKKSGLDIALKIKDAISSMKFKSIDIGRISRKANTPIIIGSSETNTWDLVKELTKMIESELSGDIKKGSNDTNPPCKDEFLCTDVVMSNLYTRLEEQRLKTIGFPVFMQE